MAALARTLASLSFSATIKGSRARWSLILPNAATEFSPNGSVLIVKSADKIADAIYLCLCDCCRSNCAKSKSMATDGSTVRFSLRDRRRLAEGRGLEGSQRDSYKYQALVQYPHPHRALQEDRVRSAEFTRQVHCLF